MTVERLAVMLRDLVGVAGAGLVAGGTAMIYAPGGFIVAGAMLMSFAVLAAKRAG